MEGRFFRNPFPDSDSTSTALIDEKLTAFVKSLIHKNVNLLLKNWKPSGRADLYVGSSGIAWMFLKLSQSAIKDEFDAITLAKLYSDCAMKTIEPSREKKPISLLSGDAGVYITSAAIMKAKNESHNFELKKLLEGVSNFEDPSYLDDGQDELLVGRCGFLRGLRWLQCELRTEILPDTELQRLASIIIESGRSYAHRKKKKVSLMYQYHGREYLGAAHGISAILFSLLTVPLSVNDLRDVKSTIDAILKLQDEEGNFPSKFDKPEAHLVHWCHGAPGVFYLMAKSYKVFGSQKYLESCLKCGDLIWKVGLLKKGPGICHGIAGNGYVHLLLYRLTEDPKHLYRAMKFAEFLESEVFIKESRKPDRPFSLFEGVAGTVCFLIDLLQPEKAEFPFMNVFE